MRLLSDRLPLHDVKDVEMWVVAIVQEFTNRTGGYLEEHDHEDLVADLMAEAWRLSEAYDPARSSSFAKWAGYLLSRRIVDWLRRHRVHARRGHVMPTFVDADDSWAMRVLLDHTVERDLEAAEFRAVLAGRP